MKYRQLLLATTVVSAIALPQIVSAFDGTGTGRIIVAEQQDPKKKKEAPKVQQQQQQKQVQPPPKQIQQQQKQVQPPPKQIQQEQKQVQPPPKAPTQLKVQESQPKTFQKQEPKTVEPKQKFGPKQFDQKKDAGERKFGPKQDQKAVDQPKLAPKLDQKAVDQPKLAPKLDQKTGEPKQKFGPKQFEQKKDVQTGQPKVAPKLEPQTFGKPKAPPTGARVGNVNELKGKRKEERVGNQVFMVEPGNRRMFRDGNKLYIRHDEGERMRRWGNARFETRGTERYTIIHRGGYDIVTITDSRGHMLRRYRRFPDGREYGLIDNRRRFGVGAAVVGGVALLGLAAPMITMPRERYIVDMGSAPPTYLYEALDAPPLVPIERAYTLDEIRDNVELRDRVRSVDINTINFSSGSWEVSPDQIPQLQALADAMLKVIGENSSTVFMLEGHTDAVGAAEDNMSLSDRRAESVAEILTTNFNIPPENIVTQGYGEQHLRVATDGPSRENRRVQVRNITGLMAADGAPGGAPPDGPPGQPPG